MSVLRDIFYETPNYLDTIPKNAKRSEILRLFALYGSSLLSMLALLPILATLVSVGLYFALAPLKSLSGYLYWQVPVIGFLVAFLVTFILAIFRSPSATPEGANIQGYNMLKSGQYELSARLDVQLTNKIGAFRVFRDKVQHAFELDYLGRQSEAALLEAYGSLYAIFRASLPLMALSG